jgi:FMN-dependent NADH-azoreductase
MSRLLYIEASPNKAASNSTAIAQAFLDCYRAARPHDEIDRIDVWDIDLPPFDAEMIAAKFAVLRTTEAGEAQCARWAQATAIARRFNAADKYLIATPMWNYSLPYRLKHFIDVVTLPGENWFWTRDTGYVGLLKGKKAAAIYTSANNHAPPTTEGEGDDYQKGLLRRWLRLIGVNDVAEITLAPTLTDAQSLASQRERAQNEARALAAQF